MVDGVVGLQTVLGGVQLAAEGTCVHPATAQVSRLHVVLHPAPPTHNLLTDETAPVVRVTRVHQFHVLAHVFKQTKSYAINIFGFHSVLSIEQIKSLLWASIILHFPLVIQGHVVLYAVLGGVALAAKCTDVVRRGRKMPALHVIPGAAFALDQLAAQQALPQVPALTFQVRLVVSCTESSIRLGLLHVFIIFVHIQ